MISARRPRQRMRRVRELLRARECGLATLEVVIGFGALALLALVLAAVAGVTAASTTLDNAAAGAARAASISRDPATARGQAQQVVRSTIDGAGLRCEPSTSIDTSGFATALGTPSSVRVTVTCQVPMPLGLGSRTMTATSVSPIDSYRERR